MILDVVTQPSATPITLDSVKEYLGVTYSYHDDLLNSLIEDATSLLQSRCQKTMATTTYALILDAFPVFGPSAFMTPPMSALQLIFVNRSIWPAFNQTIFLPMGPVTAVNSITYLDANSGVLTTLDPSQYDVLIGGSDATPGSNAPARVCPTFGIAWPIARYVPNCVTVNYTAGYTTVPGHIRRALSYLALFLYQHRGDDGAEIPWATIDNMLAPENVGSYF
jgi:hypothetical protein